MNNIIRDFCASNDTKSVKQMLGIFNNIDILYDDGVFFYFPISNSNVQLCKALIEYFEETQFPVKNIEYHEAKDKLTKILENATDSVGLPPEMKEVFSLYLDFDDLDVSNYSLFEDVELQVEIGSTESVEYQESSNLIGVRDSLFDNVN